MVSLVTARACETETVMSNGKFCRFSDGVLRTGVRLAPVPERCPRDWPGPPQPDQHEPLGSAMDGNTIGPIPSSLTTNALSNLFFDCSGKCC